MRMNPLIVAAALAATSCAGLRVQPVPHGSDECARGIRYYEASPYLLVYTDNQGGLKTELKWLPDLSRKMSAEPYALLASNNVTLSFENGVLTKGLSSPDSTAVPKALLAAIEKVAAAAALLPLSQLPTTPEGHIMPAPYLYKICLGEHGEFELRGDQGKGGDGNPAVIRVTLPEKAP